MATSLANGSDIRGIAIKTEEYEANLTVAAVTQIANGLAHWAEKLYPEKLATGSLVVGVGRDSRLSGPALMAAFMDQLAAQGIKVYDFGLATTPALFMATQFTDFDCDFGVMLTASHLPYYFNGLKFFSKSGGAEHEDIEFILAHDTPVTAVGEGEIVKADLVSVYAADLKEKILKGTKESLKEPLKGLKIVLDAGNGAGGFFAEKVLQPLGADTTGSQFLEPDGHFPNHIPNPDNKEAMASIQQAVLANQADLGIIFDTDVDRAAVVTASGQTLNRNNLIAVLAKIILAEVPGTSIVTNSPTSSHLKDFIESLGGKQVRYISGYRNVINKALELNASGVDTQLAIETSGHAAFKENYFLDDGAYVVAKILMLLPTLQAQGITLDDLIKDLKQPAETLELRFKLKNDDYRSLGMQVIADLSGKMKTGWQVDLDNEEGIRVNLREDYGSGWFLLRMSLHEPLLVLQIENDEAGQIAKLLPEIHEFLADYPEVDQEKLLALL